MPDLGNSSVFNQADASNASGTMPSWSGAAAPSTLDDAGRALQGAVTREWNWRSYTLTAGGTADAKTLTYSVAPAAYYNGQRFAFIANTTNTTSATLNVNSLGAKVIKKDVSGTLTNLSASDMVSGVFVEVAYNTANDCFVWVNRGIYAFPAGTAALPSITTTGDANTGFWFPAADTIAASTAGVERMRFKDDATIGIGTSTTNAKVQIDVADYPTNPIVTVTNGASYGMFLNPGNSTILKAGFGTYTNTPLGILTNNVERMYIDASGNVGINSAPGTYKFAVVTTGTTNFSGALINGPAGANDSGGLLRVFTTNATSTNYIAVFGNSAGSQFQIDGSGNALAVGSGGLGYGTGSGGAVTQATSKLTGVTLNKTNGQITTANSSIIANGNASFTVTNSTVAATDNIIVTRASGGTGNRYTIQVSAVAAGSFDITILNNSAASQSDVIVINFAVIKAVTA